MLASDGCGDAPYWLVSSIGSGEIRRTFDMLFDRTNPVVAWVLRLAMMFALIQVYADPTPQDQRLAPGELTLIAAPTEYQAPGGVPWPADNLFHYLLYLPDDYNETSERYPVIFIASPRGDAEMGPLSQRLKRDRWVVVLLVESRNQSVLWLPNFTAAYDDVVRRVRVDGERLFCTGFSGAARACSVYPSVRSGFRGLLLQSAGLMRRADYLSGDNVAIAVYGTFGAEDFNRREAWQLRAGLPSGVARLTEIWPGGHEWAPQAVIERALDWIEAKVFANTDSAWYWTNQLRRYANAENELERFLIAQRLRERDPPTAVAADERKQFDALKAAYPTLPQEHAERRAHAAFAELEALDEQARAPDDLAALAERYGELAEQFRSTVYGKRAATRQQSLKWEIGRP